MTINLQSIFISSIISEKKTSGCKIKAKKIMFESISMDRACRRLFKPCHQAPLKQNKCMHYL